jgi:modulator of FtsH protease
MSGWESFFSGELGAAAALVGLVFVGISINLTKIMESSHLPNRALEALVTLVTVLFVSSLMLVPVPSLTVAGVEVLCIGLLFWGFLLGLHISNLRRMHVQYRLAFLRVIVLGQLAALSFIIAGLVMLIAGAIGLYLIVSATLLSFLAAFSDAWVLVIEINR